MSAVFWMWLNFFTIFSIFNRICSPLFITIVAFWVRNFIFNIVKKDFIVSRRGTNPFIICRPIYCIDPSRVSLIFCYKMITILSNFIKVDMIVMRTYCKIVLVRGISCYFTMMFSVLQCEDLFVKIIKWSNTNFS